MTNSILHKFLNHNTDFEYNKYLLLAFLSAAEQDFKARKLYPYWEELKLFYRQISKVKDHQTEINDWIKGELQGFDLKTYQLYFKDTKGSMEKNIERILEYTLPQIQRRLSDGESLYQQCKTEIQMETVGIVPLYLDQGYLLANNKEEKQIHVYNYCRSGIQSEENQEPGWAIQVSYIKSYPHSIQWTNENIKTDLIHSLPDMPTPVTFYVESQREWPLTHTFLPVAKKVCLEYLSATKRV